MGNQNSSIQQNSLSKHTVDEKHTASSDSQPNFEDFQEIEPEYFEDNKIIKFLDQSFKQKKIASKEIQFKLIKQTQSMHKNSKLNEQFLQSRLEEFQQSINQSNIYSQIEDMNSSISQQDYFSDTDALSRIYNTQNMRNSNKQRSAMRSSFASYDSKYKKLNIKPQKFVKVRNLKFENSYEMLKTIGQGTAGRVFEAKCRKTGEIRAVKVLKPKFMKRLHKKHVLHTELDMLKNFDHPNIIRVYDVFYTGQLYYIVTQYCSGGTLLEYALSHKSIDEKIIKIITKQLLGALCYLHSHSIIHRDIKMENIVLKKNPIYCENIEDVQIKIIDFGLAKTAKFKAINKDSPCLGTPLYMAPQILKGQYSQKCDIWAAGVILHYLLFNELPFQSSQIQQIYRKIASQQIDYSKAQWKKIPIDLQELLKNMLEKRSARRICASDALKSQWLSDTINNIGSGTQKNLIFKKLASYKKENNFISIIESYIIFAKSIKNENQQKLIKLFQKFDQNNNGGIEIHELQQILKENIFLNNQNNNCSIKQMMSKIDKNNSGTIEISEFFSLFMDRNNLFSDQSLRNAFDFFDENKDGFIDRHELELMLQGCDKEQCDDLLKDLDTDEDNKISRDQFIAYVRRGNDQVKMSQTSKSITFDQQ